LGHADTTITRAFKYYFGSSYYDLFDAKNLKHSASGGDAAS